MHFQAMNLLQKANLNKNLLLKTHLNEKKVENYTTKNFLKKLKLYIKMDKKLWNLMILGLKNMSFINVKALL